MRDRLCFGKSIPRPRRGICRHKHVCVRESRVGQSKTRVAVDGLFEVSDRSLEIVSRALIPEIPAFEIVLISDRVLGRTRVERVFFSTGQLCLTRIRNFRSDLTFNSKDVRQLPIELLGPNMGVSLRID